jgi:hypothetical protein
MRRSHPIAFIAATALVLPSAAAAADTPTELLAIAAPLTDATPAPRDARSVSPFPIADVRSADAATLLAANPRQAGQLLAQAPSVRATPPASSLPRTGPELWLTLLTGAGLLLAGTGLRLAEPAAGAVSPAPAR